MRAPAAAGAVRAGVSSGPGAGARAVGFVHDDGESSRESHARSCSAFVGSTMRTTPSGERVIALHLPSGQLFGIAPALGHIAYPASAIAAGECLALSWPVALWSDFVARYEGFATETYRSVGKRLREMNDRIVELATQQVEQRIASALLKLTVQSGRPVENGVLIDFPLSREEIADLTAFLKQFGKDGKKM